ncbi:hypothetical protein JYT44_01920 [Caldithrix abyssi]|nr:hypothetical protein [Caldithrix abyssi]
MKWIKKGLIYAPDGTSSWAKHSALTPTPILIDPNTIRVYAGFRTKNGVSRIGFVDVDAENPSKIKAVSSRPVLDVGAPGTFDDNGVILGDIIEHDDQLYMYYIGFQLVEKVKFLAFTGLAISTDGGTTFLRYSSTPVLDRSDKELYFRAIHSVMIEDGVWKVWCGVGSDWEWIDGKAFPKYHIKYYESEDGLSFPQEGKVCIDFKSDEYRIGRPRVIKENGSYKMFYTKGTLKKDYVPGYAKSDNGTDWIRMDRKIGIEQSESGWDSKMLCYPSIINYDDKVYMFYNGNDYGKTGFGYAVLEN